MGSFMLTLLIYSSMVRFSNWLSQRLTTGVLVRSDKGEHQPLEHTFPGLSTQKLQRKLHCMMKIKLSSFDSPAKAVLARSVV